MSIFEKLADPFPPERVHIRKGGGGIFLAYIDARDVMERLDEVVGPDNWSDSYEETPSGRIICSLSLYVVRAGEGVFWVTKSDGAGDTGIESQKGAISDAFKRAAVKWGIGRYLYDLPTFRSKEDGVAYLKNLGFSSKAMKTKCWKALRDAAANNDAGAARETWDELTTEQQMELWRELASGQRSTLKELLESTGSAVE